MSSFWFLQVVDTLCHLRLLEEMEPPSKEPENLKKGKKKDFVNKKKKKLMREEKELQRDLKEAEAEYSKEEKQRLHTQTLKIVFHIFFRILKNMINGTLLSAVLRGLAKFGSSFFLFSFFFLLLAPCFSLLTAFVFFSLGLLTSLALNFLVTS